MSSASSSSQRHRLREEEGRPSRLHHFVRHDLHAHLPEGVELISTWRANESIANRVLTREALEFITELQRRFGPERETLLERRRERMGRILEGELPDFLPETREIRESDWKVAPIPLDLLDRRVEITGPVDRKMIINALNSGARVFMADFEDSHAPTWEGTLSGQHNLMDAIRRTISYESPPEQGGKRYELKSEVATLMVRPRGWHLPERHIRLDGKAFSGSLFDFGLYFFHNARELLLRGTGPYFYLPKLESRLEARLWNDVFNFVQDALGIPRGTIRATVLIETILAAFEMDEILYELREHSAGLNCGRWDYIFSVIKKFGHRPEFVMPDRAQVTMEVSFLRSYCELLVRTCHRRGAHAMGGMAAQIPIKPVDPEAEAANLAALDKVRADKLREVKLGHDGTWVAHPGLVPIAMEIFDQYMPAPNQIATAHGTDREITARDLLDVPAGEVTETGLRTNVRVALQYLESWLRGIGCVPIANLMEDAATAEISRAQIWQWIRHGRVKREDFSRVLREEVEQGAQAWAKGEGRKLEEAAKVLSGLVESEEFVEFLTLPAYEHL